MGCTCRTTGPGVVLNGGAGVSVDGAGTFDSPFVVSATISSTPIVQVRDTDTVNMTLTGSGREEDPYLIRADTSSAQKLQGLGDVISDAPALGSVPTWVAASGDEPAHFEFLVPSTGSSSTAATSLTGIIPEANLPDRIKAIASFVATGVSANTLTNTGFYRGSGLANAPGSSWFYYEVIQHTTAYVVQRAFNFFSPYESYERRLDNGVWQPWVRQVTTVDLEPTTGAGILDDRYARTDTTAIARGNGTVAAGWKLNRFDLAKVNHVVTLDLYVTRTGAAIPGTAGGNIANTLVGNVGSWRPVLTAAPLTSGADGWGASGVVLADGSLYLTAMPPGVDFAVNGLLTLGGTWITAS